MNLGTKDAQPPASKACIEALLDVVVGEELKMMMIVGVSV